MRRWRVITLFIACAAVLLGVAGWLGATAWRFERVQRGARYTRWIEETARLALWRMETAMVPVVAPEAARRAAHFRPLVPAWLLHPLAHAASHADAAANMLLPSPLLLETPPFTLLHFELEPGGRLTSPQVPLGADRAVALELGFATVERIAAAEARLARLHAILQRDGILGAYEAIAAKERSEPASGDDDVDARDVAAYGEKDAADWMARNETVQQAQLLAQDRSAEPMRIRAANRALADLDESAAPLSPRWVGDQLLLLRRATVSGRAVVQGCWLDWPAISTRLLQVARDALPQAQLRAAAGTAPGGAFRLAALPIELVPGDVPEQRERVVDAARPFRATLAFAGVSLLLAVAAVGALFVVILAFGERRAAFVSAVTHELRTPLTTLRLYSDLLCEKRVAPDKVDRYLATLRREATRLASLVENVLLHSRLEARGAAGRSEVLSLRALLERVNDRAKERAEQAGMRFEVLGIDEHGDRLVRADVAAAEQIVFNLVDNACKYAAGAADPRITIELDRAGAAGELVVRDRGPGIPRREARRLFKPFSRAEGRGPRPASGVGLGLALSRRLARSMGGDLRFANAADGGACFTLRLPQPI